MPMTMTAPTTTQTRTQPQIGFGGGGGTRVKTKARTGGNGDESYQRGDAGDASAGLDWKHKQPRQTPQAEMEIEEAQQHLNAHNVDSVRYQAAVRKEGVRTLKSTLEEQKQKTSNANDKYTLARGQGARIRQNIQNTATQLQGDMLKGQGAQIQNQVLQGQNGLNQGLGMQMLRSMSTQLSVTTAQNDHREQLASYQGWGNQLTGGSNLPVASRAGLGGFQRASGFPSVRGFGRSSGGVDFRSDFKRPWLG